MFTEREIEYCFERERSRVTAYDRGKLIGVCMIEDAGVFWAVRHINVDPAYSPRDIARGLLQCLYHHSREWRIKIDNLPFVPART